MFASHASPAAARPRLPRNLGSAISSLRVAEPPKRARGVLKPVLSLSDRPKDHPELRAATSVVRLSRDEGKRTEVRDLPAPVYNWFAEGFDTPVLKEARALPEQLSA